MRCGVLKRGDTMKKTMGLLLVMMLCALCGCSKTENDMPEEYRFIETNVGKTSAEVKELIGDDWTDQSVSGSDAKQYQDTDGNNYIFYNDRLTAVRYAYGDAEQGFQKCMDIYAYINRAVGEENKNAGLQDEKTLKDVQSLEAFQSYGGERTSYDVASNWYFAKDPSQWECMSQSEAAQSMWQKNDGRPVLVLNAQMADEDISVAIGYFGVPKES